MKYMGSKRQLLGNGLGTAIASVIDGAERFVDLFAGSGAVATHVAGTYGVPVVAVDLQEFSAFLCGAVIGRTRCVNGMALVDKVTHLARAYHGLPSMDQTLLKGSPLALERAVRNERRRAGESTSGWFSSAYGGYYYSMNQSETIAALRDAAERLSVNERLIVVAALIRAASRVCAAPGHTAQPFSPSGKGLMHIVECWGKSVMMVFAAELEGIAQQKAKVRGTTVVGNANSYVAEVGDGDVVFLDPPYSAVHYSRFYHVLESIARGDVSGVSGTGRYPPPEERPRSDYSVASLAPKAISDLLSGLGGKDVTIVLTYPERKCSNGIYGKALLSEIRKYFGNVEVKRRASRFSTLGGTGETRWGRQSAAELIIIARRS